MKAIDKLIATAEAEIGYLEKKSNKDLDDKTANAGSSNYTKYNRDLKAWTGVGSRLEAALQFQSPVVPGVRGLGVHLRVWPGGREEADLRLDQLHAYGQQRL